MNQGAQHYDWAGFDRRILSAKVGEITCQRCRVRWRLSKCTVNKPSEQIIASLLRHQEGCRPQQSPSI